MGDHHHAAHGEVPVEHDDHHHGGHQRPHFTELERRLYKRPQAMQNSCTDYSIAYDSCVREYATNPISFIFSVFWADRWLCKHEKHDLSTCETQRAEASFKRNFGVIKANRQGELE